MLSESNYCKTTHEIHHVLPNQVIGVGGKLNRILSNETCRNFLEMIASGLTNSDLDRSIGNELQKCAHGGGPVGGWRRPGGPLLFGCLYLLCQMRSSSPHQQQSIAHNHMNQIKALNNITMRGARLCGGGCGGGSAMVSTLFFEERFKYIH
jgi:hypothetical protein